MCKYVLIDGTCEEHIKVKEKSILLSTMKAVFDIEIKIKVKGI